MRTLQESGTLGILSSEIFSVLQLRTANEPLLPNLKSLQLRFTTRELIPFIPLFLSPRTTAINIEFLGAPSAPRAVVASILTTLATLCPNLETAILPSLPRGPMITTAVSRILLTNRNTLRHFDVDSTLTEEAREVVYTLRDLRELSVIIERDTPLSSAVLPNLTSPTIAYDHADDACDLLRMFDGATLGKLESATFSLYSEQIGGFLGAFERAALAASVQNTFLRFRLLTFCPWDPSYTSLLPFTQLTHLVVDSFCDDGCSSSVDDDIIDLAQAMPKLEHLRLGDVPCRRIPIGVTSKGLVALAYHCQHLASLCIHFQVASLGAPLATIGIGSDTESTNSRRDCALEDLNVGGICMLEESVLMIALTLTRIFPRIKNIGCADKNWGKVTDAINLSRKPIDSHDR